MNLMRLTITYPVRAVRSGQSSQFGIFDAKGRYLFTAHDTNVMTVKEIVDLLNEADKIKQSRRAK